MKRLIVGMSGASGTPYATRLLQLLQELPEIETHLVMTNSAKLNIKVESKHTVEEVEAMADVVHNVKNIGASIASGSFKTIGMIVTPCSMKTLSAIVNSYSDNLVARAADVVLKERRRLVIVPRETPLHAGHCKLMYEACLLGAQIAPAIPAFYNQPKTIDDLINAAAGRALDLFDIDPGIVKRWEGLSAQQY